MKYIILGDGSTLISEIGGELDSGKFATGVSFMLNGGCGVGIDPEMTEYNLDIRNYDINILSTTKESLEVLAEVLEIAILNFDERKKEFEIKKGLREPDPEPPFFKTSFKG